MQFKPITAIIVFFLVLASLLVSGCTTTNTGTLPSTSPYVTSTTPTYTPTSSGDVGVVSPEAFGNKITQYLKDHYPDLIIVTPFAYRGKVNGHPTYTGVIQDGSSSLKVWNRTMTYTLLNNRSEAKTVFSEAQTTAKSQGYGDEVFGEIFWIGLSGGTWLEPVGTNKVAIWLCQPTFALCGEDYYTHFNDYYAVSTVYMTRIE